MKNEEFYNSLSEEVKQKLAGCRTAEEAKKVLSEAGVEPLDDELLDEVAGGLPDARYSRYRPVFDPDPAASSGVAPRVYTPIK